MDAKRVSRTAEISTMGAEAADDELTFELCSSLFQGQTALDQISHQKRQILIEILASGHYLSINTSPGKTV